MTANSSSSMVNIDSLSIFSSSCICCTVVEKSRLCTLQVRNAPNFEDLSIESWDQIQITGSEGVKVTSKKETDIQAQHVFMNATVSTVKFNN